MHQRIQLLEIRRTRVVVKPGRPNEEKPIPEVEHHVHAANASSYCLIDTLKIRVDSTAPLLHWKHRQAGTRRVPQALLRGLRYCRAPASFSNSVQPYASVCLGHQISSHGKDTAASAGSWQSSLPPSRSVPSNRPSESRTLRCGHSSTAEHQLLPSCQ